MNEPVLQTVFRRRARIAKGQNLFNEIKCLTLFATCRMDLLLAAILSSVDFVCKTVATPCCGSCFSVDEKTKNSCLSRFWCASNCEYWKKDLLTLKKSLGTVVVLSILWQLVPWSELPLQLKYENTIVLVCNASPFMIRSECKLS